MGDSLLKTHNMRLISAQDNPAIAHVIRLVSAQCGLTADKGYAVADPNLDTLYETYCQPSHAYWVVELNDRIVGGGGVAPLVCNESDICELQKMYFLPEARGKGLAKTLVMTAMAFAYGQGFRRCYLETTASLAQAIALYERLGFEHIAKPLGRTGHIDCEVRMLKVLQTPAHATESVLQTPQKGER